MSDNKKVADNSNPVAKSNVINFFAVKSANGKKQGNYYNPYADKTEIASKQNKIFQKNLDIQKFNNIAMSNIDDLSYMERMDELFADGVVDAFDDNILSSLADNPKLLEDLNK